MALFFDAVWFDETLAQRGLDRGSLTAACGLDRHELHQVFTHQRAPTPVELNAFAEVMGVDIVEVTLRSGVAEPVEGGDAMARIDSIEARLDAIDRWIEEFEQARKRA